MEDLQDGGEALEGAAIIGEYLYRHVEHEADLQPTIAVLMKQVHAMGIMFDTPT